MRQNFTSPDLVSDSMILSPQGTFLCLILCHCLRQIGKATLKSFRGKKIILLLKTMDVGVIHLLPVSSFGFDPPQLNLNAHTSILISMQREHGIRHGI